MARLTERAAMEIFCNTNGGITIKQDGDGAHIPDALVTFDYHDAPIIIEMIQNACEEAKEFEKVNPEK